MYYPITLALPMSHNNHDYITSQSKIQIRRKRIQPNKEFNKKRQNILEYATHVAIKLFTSKYLHHRRRHSVKSRKCCYGGLTIESRRYIDTYRP